MTEAISTTVIDERFNRVWDRFTALAKLEAERAAAQAMAITKAEQALADYKVNSNEFRGALSDMASRLMPRAEYDSRHTMLVDKVNSLDSRVLQNTAVQTGRSSGISTIGYVFISVLSAIVGLLSIVSALVTLLHTPTPPQELQAKMDALTSAVTAHLRENK